MKLSVVPQNFQQFLRQSPSGPNFMALLTVSTESALTEAGNSLLTSSVFHELAGNVCLLTWVHHDTRQSSLTQLAKKFGARTV